jgi:hypothetical protein
MYFKKRIVLCCCNLSAIPGTKAGHMVACLDLHQPLHHGDKDPPVDQEPDQDPGTLFCMPEPADLRRYPVEEFCDHCNSSPLV